MLCKLLNAITAKTKPMGKTDKATKQKQYLHKPTKQNELQRCMQQQPIPTISFFHRVYLMHWAIATKQIIAKVSNTMQYGQLQ